MYMYIYMYVYSIMYMYMYMYICHVCLYMLAVANKNWPMSTGASQAS